MSLSVGIDLGGTHVRAALVDQSGKIITMIQEETEAHKGYTYVIDKMIKLAEKLIVNQTIKGIGIGAPGPLDYKTGVILSPPNLPGWEKVPIVNLIANHFNVPVYLNNDANVAALAEARIGSGRDYESVYYITVSTGIGGGFVINKQIFNGAQGYAGEIGNMILNPNGYKHSNLNKGSFESYSSGTAIGRVAAERLHMSGGAKQVFSLADEGNELAQNIIEEAVSHLAMGIANIAHTVNPAVFVLGGGVMKSEKWILEPLRQKVKEFVFPELARSIQIKPAALGGHAGVVGAAMLVP
ncbi:ROK family protein [Bacillus sp. HMF5848]|uniref:ROK family protein n=1 Tax=Bacillus sp. HMF5848 TaxID=2495421 RepID=UPI000F77197C|nr:ROK family protein [Bacillus sp. HMF5848]RSK28334.1 ROK family protein [Bacillus sp. HMF5848]